jgi:hypothetical protein
MEKNLEFKKMKFISILILASLFVAGPENTLFAQKGRTRGPTEFERYGGRRPGSESERIDAHKLEELRKKYGLSTQGDPSQRPENPESRYHTARAAAEQFYQSGDHEKALEYYSYAIKNLEQIGNTIQHSPWSSSYSASAAGLIPSGISWKKEQSLILREKISIIARTSTERADIDYANYQWSDCSKNYTQSIHAYLLVRAIPSYENEEKLKIEPPKNKISTFLNNNSESDSVANSNLDPIKRNTLRLEEALSALCKNAYIKALQDGSWQSASIPSLQMKNARYISESKKKEAEDYIRRIGNHEVVNKMPRGSSVIDVVPDRNKIRVHIANNKGAKQVEFDGEIDSPETLFSLKVLQDSKRILLTNNANKILPTKFSSAEGFSDKIIWRDPDIKEAGGNINELSKEHFSAKDFAAAILLPRNAEQQNLIGLNWTPEQRERAWNSSQYFLKNSEISDVITDRVNRGGLLGYAYEKVSLTKVRENIIEALQTKKNILIVFAHGNRERIYLPNGETLSSEEISKLDLSKNKPVVLLFSCEGGKPGEKSGASLSFEEALKKAGAKAVLTFEEKVDASIACIIAGKLFDKINSSKQIPILDALEETVRDIQKKGQEEFPHIRFKAHQDIKNYKKRNFINIG